MHLTSLNHGIVNFQARAYTQNPITLVFYDEVTVEKSACFRILVFIERVK